MKSSLIDALGLQKVQNNSSMIRLSQLLMCDESNLRGYGLTPLAYQSTKALHSEQWEREVQRLWQVRRLVDDFQTLIADRCS